MFLGESITFDEVKSADTAALAGISFTVQNPSIGFLERLKAGDAEAFDTLVNRFAPDIFALVYRLTNDRDEANDITQETFLSAVTGIARFRGDSELKTWLYRIAINHARNRFRWWQRRKRNKTFSLDEPLGEGNLTTGDLIPDNGIDPESATLARERQAAIGRELGNLPSAFREAVVLCDIEGYSYDEVAQLLGIGIGTVKSRIARGRSILRQRLKDF